ncbi:MAG: pitrilysin family protein [Clostridia bacterium]
MINMKKKVLDNGLTVCFFPKKGFTKSYAILATNYGAVDSIFTTNEGNFETPQGVAHYLEHKMFDQEDGTNALGLFGETGASPNAFTSQTMTAYYFECTDKFDKNLEILLKFVGNPYFTPESVEKEQGIIGQEIKMVEDNPNWMCFVNLFEAMYHNHPIKESIIGTVESIAKIDSEMLYLCHKVFYNASNMVLCVAGDEDFDYIVQTAQRLYPKPSVSLKSRDYRNEPESVVKAEISVKMEVSLPIFMLGFKENEFLGTNMENEVLASIALKYLLGKSSELYSKLYNDDLINRGFSGEYTKFPCGGAIIMSGQSKNPELVREIITNSMKNIKVNEHKLKNIIRLYTGTKIRMLDNFDDLCINQVDAFFNDGNVMDFQDALKKITPDIVEKYIKNMVNNISLSMIKPN